MQNIRGVLKAQRQERIEARQCKCGAWFTVKGRRDRTQCFRCECLEEGQASEKQRQG